MGRVQNPVHLPHKTMLQRPKVARTCGVLYIFDFEMHLNSQKCSDRGVLCILTTSQLPKALRTRQFLTLLTSKCASRHNGVQFFISHLTIWLRTRRFSEPPFRPSGATNHWKNTVVRDFLPFARLHLLSSHSFSPLIFSLLLFSSLTLPISAFHLSILSEV